MKESLPESSEQLLLKKRARRRLIGAIVFVSFAAVVLPMVMDEEPPPASPNIELNIPAQEKGFLAPSTGAPKNSPVGVAEPVPATTPTLGPTVAVAEAPALPPKLEASSVAARQADAKPEAKQKPIATPVAKAPELKPVAKVVKPEPVKPAKVETPKVEAAKPVADAKRAQSILEGKAAETAAGSDGPHVVLIGAFANSGNVQVLQKKLGEMGLKVYTEPLDSPQGKKTRVRVGPFANREAAEKAVARMKSIGVGGVVAPKS